MKIVIIGAGNMGGWLARSLASENELMVMDQYPEKSKQISLQNSKIQSLSSMEEIKKFKPGFLINAVS
ncbi:MAG: NAD(P)-binding domain-containing protein, partial [Candidatus Aminicenantaceae bacterium]